MIERPVSKQDRGSRIRTCGADLEDLISAKCSELFKAFSIRKLLLALALIMVPLPVNYQQTKADCRALAERLVAEAPGDAKKCIKPVKNAQASQVPVAESL